MTTIAEAYRIRMTRVLHHIDANLDQPLDVEALSGVAAFSKFHFHRQFSALFGIGVAAYIQLMRLKRASQSLAYRDTRVLDIALAAGFEGPEAFTRAFKRAIGQSPTQFRKGPDWTTWHDVFDRLSQIRSIHMPSDMPAVSFTDFPETRVAMLTHRGRPERIGDSIRDFIAWRKANGLPPSRSATFNILHSDPLGDADAYRLDLCAATDRDVAPNDTGIGVSVIPGGRCAVLRHRVRPTPCAIPSPGCTANGYRTAARNCATFRSLSSASPSSPMLQRPMR